MGRKSAASSEAREVERVELTSSSGRRETFYLFHDPKRKFVPWSGGRMTEALGTHWQFRTEGEARDWLRRSLSKHEAARIEEEKERLERAVSRVGCRVVHDQFGPGKVVGVEDQKVIVDFDECGRKVMLMQFLSVADEQDDNDVSY